MPNSWPAPVAPGHLQATVTVAGSKSITNRALVLASLAQQPSALRAPLRSRDTELMATGLRALGTAIEDGPDGEWLVTPQALSGRTEIDCGLAGTVMRFLPPVAALANGNVAFDGDPRARERPLGTLLDALRSLGVDVRGNVLPFEVTGVGGVPGGSVEIDASATSQFVSGLLLSAPRFKNGLTISHIGSSLPSLPHITMTVAMLRERGVTVDEERPDRWQVRPGPIAGLDIDIEPDLSNATPFLAAAAVTGGEVTVSDWPAETTQAGDAMRDILVRMGADVRRTPTGLTVHGPGKLDGIDADLHDIGELTPTIAALAALAHGRSRLRGVAHLRGHETDRLAALERELSTLGASVEQTEDGLVIDPGPLHGGTWHAYEDHRMATAGAIIGLRVPGVTVDDIATTSKTMPDFPAMWSAMLA